MEFEINDIDYNKKLERDTKLNEFKRVCKHCGWVNLVFNKYHRVLCKNCKNFVYYNKKDEFKYKLKGRLK